MDLDQKKAYLKKAFWDSNFESDDLFLLLCKQRQEVGGLTLEKLYLRLLETYSWHKLIDIVPQDRLSEMLAMDIVMKLRSAKLRERYTRVAELLTNIEVRNRE